MHFTPSSKSCVCPSGRLDGWGAETEGGGARYYGTIPTTVSNADGIAFIQGMKAAVEDNQKETQFREYGTSLLPVQRSASCFEGGADWRIRSAPQ